MLSSPMRRGTGGRVVGRVLLPPVPSSGLGRRCPLGRGGSRWDDPRFLPGRAGPAWPGVCVTKGLHGRLGTGWGGHWGKQGWLESVELPCLHRGSSEVLKASPAGVLGEDWDLPSLVKV